MEELKITVYDDDGKVVKECSAVTVNLKYGAIRSLMELINIDSIDDTAALLKTVYNAWEELTKILSKCFPDMEYDDWDNVELKELIPVLFAILTYSFGEILTIPQSKN